MCLELYAGLFDRVLDEVNSFLIFSNVLRLLDLATLLFVKRKGGATKLIPCHLLHQSMLDSFINEFEILVFVVTGYF